MSEIDIRCASISDEAHAIMMRANLWRAYPQCFAEMDLETTERRLESALTDIRKLRDEVHKAGKDAA